MEILEDNKEKFGIDFLANKKVLNEISIVRSKGLKNELAGCITKFIKREIREKEEQLLKENQIEQEESTPDVQSIPTNDEETLPELEIISQDETEESS